MSDESIRLVEDPFDQLKVEPILLHPFPSEWDGLSMNRLADALDDEEALRELGMLDVLIAEA
ncbi:MAG: hypothetical protein ACQKBV_08060 [Puniceicoccales bacterium]